METRRLTILLLGSAVCAFAQPDAPKTIYDSATRAEEQGNLDAARTALAALANTYTGTPLAARAKTELGAICLFQEGQEQVQTGRVGPALITFDAVAQVYPESPLAKQAEAARQALQPNSPLLSAVDFKNVPAASKAEVLQRFQEREAGLDLDKPYDEREVQRATAALIGLLSERGVTGARVKVDTVFVSPRALRLVFTVVKP